MSEEIVTQRVAHTPGPWSEHALLTDREVKQCSPSDGSEPFEYRSLYIGSGNRVVAEAVMWTAGKNGGFERVDNVEEQDANARLIAAAPKLLEAVRYMLDRIQTDPNVHYYCGFGTQSFYLLIQAEAEALGLPLADVEKERKQDRQPHYRKVEPEVLRLRDQLDELRRECGR